MAFSSINAFWIWKLVLIWKSGKGLVIGRTRLIILDWFLLIVQNKQHCSQWVPVLWQYLLPSVSTYKWQTLFYFLVMLVPLFSSIILIVLVSLSPSNLSILTLAHPLPLHTLSQQFWQLAILFFHASRTILMVYLHNLLGFMPQFF